MGLLRRRLRRTSGTDPDRDARRLARPPAAQGLPARRHPRRVQRRHHPAAGHAEELLMIETTLDGAAERPILGRSIDCGLRPRGLGGIPIEYKGATIPPPD